MAAKQAAKAAHSSNTVQTTNPQAAQASAKPAPAPQRVTPSQLALHLQGVPQASATPATPATQLHAAAQAAYAAGQQKGQQAKAMLQAQAALASGNPQQAQAALAALANVANANANMANANATSASVTQAAKQWLATQPVGTKFTTSAVYAAIGGVLPGQGQRVRNVLQKAGCQRLGRNNAGAIVWQTTSTPTS
jgi:hypothetical protein